MIGPEVSTRLGFLHSFRRSPALGSIVFKDWLCFGFLSLSFSFFSSVGIIHFATISVVYVVMDIFTSQDTSRLFIDFCFV